MHFVRCWNGGWGKTKAWGGNSPAWSLIRVCPPSFSLVCACQTLLLLHSFEHACPPSLIPSCSPWSAVLPLLLLPSSLWLLPASAAAIVVAATCCCCSPCRHHGGYLLLLLLLSSSSSLSRLPAATATSLTAATAVIAILCVCALLFV